MPDVFGETRWIPRFVHREEVVPRKRNRCMLGETKLVVPISVGATVGHKAAGQPFFSQHLMRGKWSEAPFEFRLNDEILVCSKVQPDLQV